MFKSFSLTITGLLVVVLAEFLPVEEVEVVGQAIGIIIAWFGRYRVGDIALTGKRK